MQRSAFQTLVRDVQSIAASGATAHKCAIPRRFNGIVTKILPNGALIEATIDEELFQIFASKKLIRSKTNDNPYSVGQQYSFSIMVDQQAKFWPFQLSLVTK